MGNMGIGGTGGASYAMRSGASPIAGGRFDNQYQGAMSSVASLLGMNVADLKTAARSESLDQIASSKGVGEDKLEAAIKQGLQSSGTQLGGTRLDNIAHRIATRRHHEPGARRDGVVDPTGSGGSVTGGTRSFGGAGSSGLLGGGD